MKTQECAKAVLNDCKLRIIANTEAIEKRGMFPELIIASLEDCFLALENMIELPQDDIDETVRIVEYALEGQTKFLETFKKCIYILYYNVISHNKAIFAHK